MKRVNSIQLSSDKFDLSKLSSQRHEEYGKTTPRDKLHRDTDLSKFYKVQNLTKTRNSEIDLKRN